VEEVVVPTPSIAPPVRRARGVLISNSVLMLRERGLFDRYIGHVPEGTRDELLGTTPGSWVPITHPRSSVSMRTLADRSEQVRRGRTARSRCRGR
jgi:hypothetical protein